MIRPILLSICLCAPVTLFGQPIPGQPITAGTDLSKYTTFQVPVKNDDPCSFAEELWPDGFRFLTAIGGGPGCDEDAFVYNLIGAGLLGTNSSRAPLSPQEIRTSAAPTMGFGSQGITSVALANGGQMNAWVSGDLLLTALLPSSSGPLQTTGQYTLTGLNPQHVTAGDFNGDGNADLAISNFGNLDTNLGGNLTILLGNRAGTFTGATVNAGVTPVAMYAADFNRDGKLDLAAANLTTGTISVILGNGDGTFKAPVAYPVADTPQSIVSADFNGDGHLDIAVANQSGIISVLLGDGDGTFQPAVSYSGGQGGATYMAWQDLNGDGKPDLIVANSTSNAFSFLFGNGDGSFQAPVQYATGADPQYFALIGGSTGQRAQLVTVDGDSGALVVTPVLPSGVAVSPQIYPLTPGAYGIATADMNGDGFSDVVVGDGTISILLRNPKAQLNAAVNYTLQSGSQAREVALGDLNGDGKNDVVAASQIIENGATVGGTVDVALNNGDGTLGTQHSYALGAPPSGIVMGDFNGDGKPDVAVGLSGGESVLLGNGDGTLQPAVNYSVGNFSVFSTVIGDFNGDGKLDIVAGVGTDYTAPGALVLLPGNGDGTFQNAVTIQVGSPAGTPIALATGDVNGDGIPDIVASVYGQNNSIVVLLGNGNGTFRQQAPISNSAAGGSPLALVDLNGDGVLDLVVGNTDQTDYMLGNGDGTFQTVQYFSSAEDITGLAVTDWNNDGIAGLAIANQYGSVMPVESALNLKYFGFRRLTNFSAAAGVSTVAPGSLATAYGTDLATATASPSSTPLPTSLKGTSVNILDSTGNSTAAPLVYVSPMQVNYLIPDSVASGSAIVTVTSGDGTQSAVAANLNSVAPALFTLNSSNLAAAIAVCGKAGGSEVVESVYQVSNGTVVAAPINLSGCSETVLELYATGMDSVSAGDVKVTLGGVSGSVQYAGPQGSFTGLDQINVIIPASLEGRGSVSIALTAKGQSANTVNISIH
jgi:uncharacterized protein (TIGR03437 family)